MTVSIALKRYRQHRNNALRRDIGFEFTFEQWERWWINHLGPRWLTRRGRGKNKFCMGRKNDKGSYRPGNVVCISLSENSSDREWLFTDPKYRSQMRVASAKATRAIGVEKNATWRRAMARMWKNRKRESA